MIQATTAVRICCVRYVTESHSHQSLLFGLGSGQLSLSDALALQAPVAHGGKSGAGRSGGEKKKEERKRLSEQES